MADRSWQEAPVDFRPRGRGALGAFGRWLVWLFVIAALTLGTAFYLPLHRAHRALTESNARALAQTRTLENALARARAALTGAEAARAALETENAATASRVVAERTRLASTLAALRTSLQRLVDKRVLSVDAREGRVVVGFSPGLTDGFDPNVPTAVVAERFRLCDVAAALIPKAGVAGVEVISYSAAAPGVAPAAPPTPGSPASLRDGPSRLVNGVADALSARCHVAPGRTSTVVRGEAPATDARLELSFSLAP